MLTEKWDEERTYDERIHPLMAQVIAICREHRIPMLASFAYRNGDDGADYCTTSLPFDGREIESFGEAYRSIRRRQHAVAVTITSSPGDETSKEAS